MSGGPQVRVAQGELLGRTATTASGFTYYSFQGVPYAQPPIGSLRFKAPLYPNPWTGVRDATTPGPKCAQMDPYRPKKFEGSEDCLHLNVHTPTLPSDGEKSYPVIVFVHGGRYQAGYGGYYQPDYLIEKEVILVTLNYRVNVLGFLALGLPECPGNASMKDVVFALRWVQENISRFNGDCGNVTVFGESAGAGTVSSLLTAPMAKGLFHKMILESGTFVHDIFLIKEDTVRKARKIAKMLGNEASDPRELLEFLQSVPVESLVEANRDIMRNKMDPRAFFSPVEEPIFEGVENFFPEDPIKCLREGRYSKVPMIVGSTSHEGALFVIQDKEGNIFYIQDLTMFVPRAFYMDKQSKECQNFAEEVKRMYFGDKPIDDSTKREYVELISDAMFDRDNFRFVDYALGHQRDVWSFRFSYMGSLNWPVIRNLGLTGASHSDQLPYHFKRNRKTDLTDDDRKIIEFFSEAWSNFARSGNPKSTMAGVDWLPMSKENRYCLSVDKQFQLLTFPDKERMEFWQHIYKKYGKEKSKI